MDRRRTYENKLRRFFHVKVKIQMKNSLSSLLIKRQSKEGIVSVYNKILKKHPSSSLFVKRRNKEGVTPNILSVHFLVR